MTIRRVGLFGFVLLSGAIAGAQTRSVELSQTKTAGAPAVVTVPEAAADAPAAVAAPVPDLPKRPAEMAPKPPKVTCHGDQITISADNSTLDAILFAVRGCTGAKIDVPGDASRVRTFEELGPGPVREVLDDLLSGTPYNYVIQSSEANPLKVETVLLSMRTNDAGKPGSSGSNSISTDVPMTPGRRAWKLMQKFDKPDPATLNGDDAPSEANADSPADEANATSAATSADSGAASASDNVPAETAAASTPPPAVTPVAPPIVDPNSNADPAKAMQDRIAQMQQMFAQRQQMMQKQNQNPQGGAPNN